MNGSLTIQHFQDEQVTKAQLDMRGRCIRMLEEAAHLLEIDQYAHRRGTMTLAEIGEGLRVIAGKIATIQPRTADALP